MESETIGALIVLDGMAGLRASLQKALALYRSGNPVAARLELRGDE